MAFELGKLKRRQQRGHDHIRDEDIESAQQREAQAQQALAAARQRTQHARDVLLSLDAVQYPEARYYADKEAGRAPPNGLELLHASGLFVDRRLDTDYEVGGTALHCGTSRRRVPRSLCLCSPVPPPTSLPPLQYQVLSQVSGGAHLVLHARLRHAPAASKSTTHALKVVPVHEIRQIQREVRVCQHRRRMRAWRGLRLTDPPWHVGHDPQPRAASVHHARASCVCGCHPCVRRLRWPWFVRMTPHSHTNNARRLGGDRYIQLPWCSGGDMKAWLESRTPQRTVAEACLVLHDILRVRG